MKEKKIKAGRKENKREVIYNLHHVSFNQKKKKKNTLIHTDI